MQGIDKTKTKKLMQGMEFDSKVNVSALNWDNKRILNTLVLQLHKSSTLHRAEIHDQTTKDIGFVIKKERERSNKPKTYT